MIGLLQRVSSASVTVDNRQVSSIGPGILVLVGVEKEDNSNNIKRMADRLLGYRVFPDASGKMNLSVSDTSGGVLLVPQFTLAADTRKGTRASFTSAADPAIATVHFDSLFAEIASRHPDTGVGIFGADMQVALVNDGPVTFWLTA